MKEAKEAGLKMSLCRLTGDEKFIMRRLKEIRKGRKLEGLDRAGKSY